MRRVIGRAACAAVVGVWISTLAPAEATASQLERALPAEAEIRSMLEDRLRALAGGEEGIAIVVGVVSPRDRRVVSVGRLATGDARPPDADTVFEIGSVGKLFTALVLADMVRKHELALGEPVAKYLPASPAIPERSGRGITLLDLATHTSGLPFMPDAVPVRDEAAAARYGAPQLYEFLGRCRLMREPGAAWDYSNLGYWLLGQALESRAGADYETLLRTRVTGPLELKSTAITLSRDLKARLAPGHDAALQPAPPGRALSVYAAMPEAGVGVVSTANDLLSFVSVAAGLKPSRLAPSMAAMLDERRPMGDGDQALGWVVQGKGDDELVVHDGGTWGYSSSVAWDPSRRTGVVVLSNQQAEVGDIARHLLRPEAPLETPARVRHDEIALDPAVLDGYAGRYDAEEVGTFAVVQECAYLTLQLPASWGLPTFRLRPEGRTDFFVAELPVRVVFQVDGDGRATGLLVYPPRGTHAIPSARVKSDR